jgi:hypothetical protein
MIFEEKIKPLNRTKRFAGRFWPIEAGRPIEKHEGVYKKNIWYIIF